MIAELARADFRPFLTLLVVSCGYALVRGRPPERVVALALPLAWTITQLVHSGDFTRPQYGMFIVDTVLLLLLAGLTMYCGRRWLAIAAAFQLLSVAGHVSMIMDKQIRSYAYQTAIIIWSYGVVLALPIGTFFEAELERRRSRQA